MSPLLQRALVTVFLTGGLFCPMKAADRYTITKLVPNSSTFNEVNSINNQGEITLRASVAGGPAKSYIYRNGVLSVIPDLPGSPGSFPFALNNLGHVAGASSFSSETITSRAFLYDGSVTRDLGTLSGGYRTLAYGINDVDSVVGYVGFPSGGSHAFLSAGGVLSDLGTLGGPESEAKAINNFGQVVGWSRVTSDLGRFHAFLYSDGTMTDLSLATNGIVFDPAAINNMGVIVGRSGNNRPFVYSNGVATELSAFPTQNGRAYGVNDAGVVVGSATSNRYPISSAFVYSPATGMIELNEKVTLSDATFPGFVWLGVAKDINEAGCIIGEGDYFDGTAFISQAFLLTPQITAQTPQFLPGHGAEVYYGTQAVTISTVTPGASIRFTTDGSLPSPTVGTIYTGPITIGSTTTFYAIAYGPGSAESAVSSAVYTFVAPPQAAAPTFSPAGGTFHVPQIVTIASTTSGASIRYTTDGSVPTATTGTLYTDPIALGRDVTLQAIAFSPPNTDSAVSTASYTFVPFPPAAAPAFSPTGETFHVPQVITIASASGGAFIRYTTDGSTPTATTGTLYTGPITISSDTTLQAIAFSPVNTDSAVSTVTYTFVAFPQAAAPTFSPEGGTFHVPQAITIASATEKASIRYTTDGSAPTATTGTLYTDPVTLGSDTTLQAIAFSPVNTDSAVSTASYVFVALPQAPAPTFNLPSGTYDAGGVVTITSAGYNIRYTIDGSLPASTAGLLYTAPITLTADTTLRAIAYQDLYRDSAVASATYTVVTPTAGTPVFSPAGKVFFGPQTITITSSAPIDASLRYTTDGSEPTATHGVLYTGPVPITGAVTLRAIACKEFWRDSLVGSASYLVIPLPAGAPVFSPPGGTFVGSKTITIQSPLAGATIRYTTDGSTPSATVGNIYSGPVTIAGTTTLRAIAYKAGYLNSPVTSATYILVPSPTLDYEAESLTYSATGATAFTVNDANASHNKLVELSGNSTGDALVFSLPSIPPGTYRLKLKWKGGANRGILSLKVDGTQVGGTLDQYSSSATYQTTSFGLVTFTSASNHVVTLTVTGRRSAATSYKLSADQFELAGQ